MKPLHVFSDPVAESTALITFEDNTSPARRRPGGWSLTLGVAVEGRGVGTGPAGPGSEPLNGPRLPRARKGRILVAVCIALIFLVLIASPVLFERPTVKVGLIVPLTGNASYLLDVRDGMLLALETLNKWGGMNGAEIELLVRDSESDPAKAVEAFQELERDEKPLFYVSVQTQLTLPLVPLAEENEVVLVGVVTAVQNLTEGRQWTFRFYADAQDEVDATMHTLDVLQVSDLGILHGADEFSLSVSSILSEDFAASGGSVESLLVASDDDDYSDDVSLVMDKDAVFLGMTASYLKEALLSLREAGYTGHILTPSGGTSDVVKPLPEAEGIYVVAPAMYNDNYLPAKWISEVFEARL